MTTILPAEPKDNFILADLGRKTFLEAHGHSASPQDIEKYIRAKFTPEIFKQELEDPKNIFHKIYSNNELAGYSKIIPNTANNNITQESVTKMERLYLLKPFYQLKLGQQLLQVNIQQTILLQQQGMWLYVWTENWRAINFYLHHGFNIVGSYHFQISETHANPNHVMFRPSSYCQKKLV